jgi:hypothetical protein
MSDDSRSKLTLEFHETKGALDLLFTLREEFAQWAEEAQDASKLEALENVLGHIQGIEAEYKHRFAALNQQIKAD